MKRRIVVHGNTNTVTVITYYAYSPRCFADGRVVPSSISAEVNPTAGNCYATFTNAIKLSCTSVLSKDKSYEFIVDIPYNQPALERVVEATTNGVAIKVYNENGVLVCDNGVPYAESAMSTPVITDGPGEMTSEPIDGPGEMTSEPIDGPGEML